MFIDSLIYSLRFISDPRTYEDRKKKHNKIKQKQRINKPRQLQMRIKNRRHRSQKRLNYQWDCQGICSTPTELIKD